jgi:hypothetical protein
MILTKPVFLNASLLSHDNLESLSNLTEESDMHKKSMILAKIQPSQQTHSIQFTPT